MEKYELEYLSAEFKRHSDELVSRGDYLREDFNLPIAVKTLVDELMDLKVRVKMLENQLLNNYEASTASSFPEFIYTPSNVFANGAVVYSGDSAYSAETKLL